MNWALDGTPLGEFRGLPEATINKLKHVGVFRGVYVFECGDVPPGTLELRQGSTLLAVIRGIGA